jgi:hypothetical protein
MFGFIDASGGHEGIGMNNDTKICARMYNYDSLQILVN